MAKGKESLKETLHESQIIRTNEESGKIPFFYINDDYGVSVNKYGFELVKRKEQSRAIKDEKGNIIGCETYYTWDFYKSASSFEDSLLTYSKIEERNLFSKLTKCKDFRELVKIRLQIQNTVNNAFKMDGINKDLLESCKSIESHKELELQIEDANKLINEVTKQYNDLMEFIKEKRKIIVKNTEPKKHRKMKEEE